MANLNIVPITDGMNGSGDIADHLEKSTIGVGVETSKFGLTRSLTKDQKAASAAPHNAKGRVLAAAKRLLDNRNPKYKAVTRIFTGANEFLNAVTVPHPDRGKRLLHEKNLELVKDRFNNPEDGFVARLEKALDILDAEYKHVLRPQAKEDLGSLYNEADYPESIKGEFGLELTFPAIMPDERLKKLDPELYEAAVEAERGKLRTAVNDFTEKLTEMLHGLLVHLADCLKVDENGKTKAFHSSTVDNLRGFFDTAGNLNLNSSKELNTLIEKCKVLVGNDSEGLTAAKLKNDVLLRNDVKTKVTEIATGLENIMVEKPSRSIIDLDS